MKTGVGERWARSHVTIANMFNSKVAFFGGGGGLAVIDVSSPAAPKLIKKVVTGCATSGNTERKGGGCFALLGPSGTHIYVVGGDGFAVIDASDLSKPKKIKEMWLSLCSQEGGGTLCLMNDQFLCATGGRNGCCFLDISDPADPKKVGSKDCCVGSMEGISTTCFADDKAYAYVAGGCGLGIIDISEPEKWGYADDDDDIACCCVLL